MHESTRGTDYRQKRIRLQWVKMQGGSHVGAYRFLLKALFGKFLFQQCSVLETRVALNIT